MEEAEAGKSVQDLSDDLENWMGKLPDKLKAKPLIQLAIPGSHDSFTWKITPNSDISPDAEDIVKALSHLGPLVKYILANWSITQAYDAEEQLKNGIRYFDIRLSTKDKSDELYIVHTLYSDKVLPIYEAINKFLNEHPLEIVILDHQHFYDCDENDHKKLIDNIETIFGNKLVPYTSVKDMDTLTIESLNKQKYQVLIPYRQEKMVSYRNNLWPSKYFPTPWPNTTDQEKLFKTLDDGLVKRDSRYAYVSQCVLTPDAQFILGNVSSSLKEKCAVDLEKARTEWISKQTPGPRGVNIFIADFVELSSENFTKTVINLNSKLSET